MSTLREEILEVLAAYDGEGFDEKWATNEILSKFEKRIDEHVKNFQEFDEAVGGDITQKAGIIALLGLKEDLK